MIFLILTPFCSVDFVTVEFVPVFPTFPIRNIFDLVGGAFVGVGGRSGS